MEPFTLTALLKFGQPVLLFGIIIFIVMLSERIKQLHQKITTSNGDIKEIKDDLKDMKTRLVWKDVFDELKDRVSRIENDLKNIR